MGTVTIGTDTFDVYGTAAELATYANGSIAYYAAHAAASAATIARTHVEATRRIAALPFEDDANADPATAVADVATACYELTLAALVDVTLLTQASTAKNIKRVNAKGAEVEYFGPTAGGRFPVNVMTLLSPLLASADDATTVTGGGYLSGTSECSDFDAADRYGVTSG